MATSLPIVGIGSRVFAFLIDWHIRAILALLALWMLSPSFNELRTAVTEGDFMALIVPLAIYFLYHPVIELANNGRSPGKVYLGMTVVNRHGQPASLFAILVRNIFRIIDALPICYSFAILYAFGNHSQNRLGDSIAGTRLVYKDKLDKQSSAE